MIFAAIVPAMLLAAAVTGEGQVAAVPIGGPAGWFSPDDYPPQAIREEAAGRVGFAVTIDPQGMVTDCEITEPSGSIALDQQTCAIVRLRAHFTPARDRRHRPIASTYRNRVNWRMPNEESIAIEVSGTTLRRASVANISTNADGIVTDCQVIEQSEDMSNICLAFAIGRPSPLPILHGGKRVAAKVRLVSSTDVELTR